MKTFASLRTRVTVSAIVALLTAGVLVGAASGSAAPTSLPCTVDYEVGTFECPLPPASTVTVTATETATQTTTETVTSTAPGTTVTSTAPGTTVTSTTTVTPSTTSTTASTVPTSTSTSTTATTTTTTPPPPVGPSGLAMPVGNLPGWTQVQADDFTGTALNATNWYPQGYSGIPASAPGGWWASAHVKVRDGKLVLEGRKETVDTNGSTAGGIETRFATAGLANKLNLSYGKIEVRFRMDAGRGIKYAWLMWPSGEAWEVGGEIDFAEDGAPIPRNKTTGTTHWFPTTTNHQQEQRGYTLPTGDFTTWHTAGLEWSPGSVKYFTDGVLTGTTTNAGGVNRVPDGVMHLALQTEALTNCSTPQWNTCVDATTPANVNAEFDWAVLYRPAA